MRVPDSLTPGAARLNPRNRDALALSRRIHASCFTAAVPKTVRRCVLGPDVRRYSAFRRPASWTSTHSFPAGSSARPIPLDPVSQRFPGCPTESSAPRGSGRISRSARGSPSLPAPWACHPQWPDRCRTGCVPPHAHLALGSIPLALVVRCQRPGQRRFVALSAAVMLH